MFTKGQRKGTVRFSVRPPANATNVHLAGDFNRWQPATMRRQKAGDFVCVLPLEPGTYEYKFVFDGEWGVDPDNNTYALNQYGTLNSVATVV